MQDRPPHLQYKVRCAPAGTQQRLCCAALGCRAAWHKAAAPVQKRGAAWRRPPAPAPPTGLHLPRQHARPGEGGRAAALQRVALQVRRQLSGRHTKLLLQHCRLLAVQGCSAGAAPLGARPRPRLAAPAAAVAACMSTKGHAGGIRRGYAGHWQNVPTCSNGSSGGSGSARLDSKLHAIGRRQKILCTSYDRLLRWELPLASCVVRLDIPAQKPSGWPALCFGLRFSQWCVACERVRRRGRPAQVFLALKGKHRTGAHWQRRPGIMDTQNFEQSDGRDLLSK